MRRKLNSRCLFWTAIFYFFSGEYVQSYRRSMCIHYCLNLWKNNNNTATQEQQNNMFICIFKRSYALFMLKIHMLLLYHLQNCKWWPYDLCLCEKNESIVLSETLSSTECSMCLWRIGSSLSFKGGTESNSKYISLSFSHSRGYKAYQNWLKFWDVDFEGATVIVKSSLKEKELL